MYTENLAPAPATSKERMDQYEKAKINRLIEKTRREDAIREIIKNTPEIEARGFGEISFENQRLKNGEKIIEGADLESTNILGVIVNLLQRKILELKDIETFFDIGKANNCIVLTRNLNLNYCAIRISSRRAIRFLKKYLRRKGVPLPDFLKFKFLKREIAN